MDESQPHEEAPLPREVPFIDKWGDRFWLVPGYTDQPRREVSAADILMLERVLDSLPGAVMWWHWKRPPEVRVRL